MALGSGKRELIHHRSKNLLRRSAWRMQYNTLHNNSFQLICQQVEAKGWYRCRHWNMFDCYAFTCTSYLLSLGVFSINNHHQSSSTGCSLVSRGPANETELSFRIVNSEVNLSMSVDMSKVQILDVYLSIGEGERKTNESENWNWMKPLVCMSMVRLV